MATAGAIIALWMQAAGVITDAAAMTPIMGIGLTGAGMTDTVKVMAGIRADTPADTPADTRAADIRAAGIQRVGIRAVNIPFGE